MAKTPQKPSKPGTKKPAVKSASKPAARQNRGLGKGLSALMADVAPAVKHEGRDAVKAAKPEQSAAPAAADRAAQYIAIDKLERNPAQPRRYFDPAKLEDLTRSIKEKGVLQPILARPIEKGGKTSGYQIVAGERRWQAALKAGLDQMPVMVKSLSDQEVLEIGVVENVQRANLNPIEEAQAYKALSDEFGRRQEDIAQAIGKSRSHVANMMRLLTLPTRAQDLLAQGKLSAGHARAVISAPDPAALAEMIVQKDLSVRDAEAMMRRLKKGQPLQQPAQTKSADIRQVEKSLSNQIGLKVDLAHKNPAGKLVIHYKTAEQLEDLIKRLPAGFL